MIKTDAGIGQTDPTKILVYLPFMAADHYHGLFRQFRGYQFIQYHPVSDRIEHANVQINPLSREGFLKDFSDCAGLICNAGFGACSEAIHYGKKLLVVPLQGQMEQLSNAAALEQLGYGLVTNGIDQAQIEAWLDAEQPQAANYPDVAAALAQWIVSGRIASIEDLASTLWSGVNLPDTSAVATAGIHHCDVANN